MPRNLVHPPSVKPCICKRCNERYIGGKTSNYCEKCYLPNGRNSKRMEELKCHKK
jgi:hypothetical protein